MLDRKTLIRDLIKSLVGEAFDNTDKYIDATGIDDILDPYSLGVGILCGTSRALNSLVSGRSSGQLESYVAMAAMLS